MTLFVLDPTERLKNQFDTQDTTELLTMFTHRLSTIEKYDILKKGDSLLLDMENTEWKDTDKALSELIPQEVVTFTTTFEDPSSKIFKVGEKIDFNILYATLLGKLKNNDIFLDRDYTPLSKIDEKIGVSDDKKVKLIDDSKTKSESKHTKASVEKELEDVNKNVLVEKIPSGHIKEADVVIDVEEVEEKKHKPQSKKTVSSKENTDDNKENVIKEKPISENKKVTRKTQTQNKKNTQNKKSPKEKPVNNKNTKPKKESINDFSEEEFETVEIPKKEISKAKKDDLLDEFSTIEIPNKTNDIIKDEEFETIDVGKTEKDVISDTKKVVKSNSESKAEDFVDLFDFNDEKTEKTTEQTKDASVEKEKPNDIQSLIETMKNNK